MNKLSIIIVGIDGWSEWTLPALRSIRKYEPDTQVIIVDNGSKIPYPITLDHKTLVIRLKDTQSYTKAINQGVLWGRESEWYLILNNDIEFRSYISDIVDNLDNSFIYGKQIIESGGHRWLGLWLALIPKKVWDVVGKFDENFRSCGFDDADYCIRAKNLGIDTLHINFPIIHYGTRTLPKLPNHKSDREKNIDYFEKKHGFRPDKYRVIAE